MAHPWRAGGGAYGGGEEETTDVVDVCGALLNRCYARGGWAMNTSNVTPVELLDVATVNH